MEDMISKALLIVSTLFCACSCKKGETSFVPMTDESQKQIEAYEGQSHELDGCYNDGVMWRASIEPSVLTGTSVECLIPFDDENYEEGDFIPNYYKWVFDRYVGSENEIRGLVAAHLLEHASRRGLEILHSETPEPEGILKQFRLSQVYLIEKEEAEEAQVELSFHFQDGFEHGFEILVSLEPLGVKPAM